MARPSLGSLYLSSVASQTQSRRQSEVYTRKEQNDEVEQLKAKYSYQNKTLAQQNALLTVKISEMEAKIAELINENITLRNRQSSPATPDLSKHLEVVEKGVLGKFDDILQLFKVLRNKQKLNDNPLLDSLGEVTRPVTSTPIDDSVRSPFPETNLDKILLSSLQLSESTQTPSHPRSRHLWDDPLKEASNEKSSIDTTMDDSNDDARIEDSEVDNLLKGLARSTESPIPNPPVQAKLTTEAKVTNQMKLKKASTPQETTKFSTPKEITKPETPTQTKPPTTEPVQDMRRSSTMQNATKNVYTKQKEPKLKVFQDQSAKRKKQDEKPQKTKKPKHQTPQPKAIPTQVEPMSDAEMRRPTRTKKKVNYAVPSLRKKLRRESEKFIDAVGGFYPQIKMEEGSVPQHNEVPGTGKTQEKTQEKTQDITEKPQRMPLSNVTNVGKRNSKFDYSIFDFPETDKQSRARSEI